MPDHTCCIKEAIESQAYPEGTIVKITYPEIKSEPEVVYPGGVYWDEAKGWVVNQLAKHRHYGFRFKGEG